MTTAVESRPHLHKDAAGDRIGMWLFLFTEIILFRGLFLLYAVYRSKFPADFHFSAAELDTFMGTINTAVLLTSSLTMVLAVTSMEKKNREHTTIFLMVTMLLGLVFLINKYFEWSVKFSHGLYPGSEVLEFHTAGENIFYALYYLMTGLHGLHIIIGLIILSVMFYQVVRKPRQKIRLSALNRSGISVRDQSGETLWELRETEPVHSVEMTLIYQNHDDLMDQQMIKIENSGLYWHLVSIIWIFLFPLFYLIT